MVPSSGANQPLVYLSSQGCTLELPGFTLSAHHDIPAVSRISLGASPSHRQAVLNKEKVTIIINFVIFFIKDHHFS